MNKADFKPSHVVKINTARRVETIWPAMALDDGGIMVDLRLFDPRTNLLCWRPDAMPAGFPEEYMESAGKSEPPGFIVLRTVH